MVDPWALIFWAALVLVLPLPWLLAGAGAAAFHELCHFWALRALGGQVYGISVGVTGAVMDCGPLSRGRELLAAAAGPAGSLSLLLLARVTPRLALCGLIQGLFNLLPVYPLDGGRMLRLCLPLSQRKMRAVEGILGGALCLALLHWRLALGLIVSARLIFRNIPCKNRENGVQYS